MHAHSFFPTTRARERRLVVPALLLCGVALLSGCANKSASSGVYSYGQAQREQVVRVGTITNIRSIVIQSDQSSGAGVLAGGAVGGIAGSAIGGGRGSAIAAVLGAVAGGVLGNQIEKQVDKTDGYEVTVRLDNGETRVVAQAADVPLRIGQRVQMISGGGPTRVAPY